MRIIVLMLFLIGCRKEAPAPAEVTHSVTYTLYSAHSKYIFGHCEDQYHGSPLDTISTNNYTVTFQVKDNALDFYQYIGSLSKYPSDSLYMKAEYEGKKVEAFYAYKVNGGKFVINIQLSKAK